MFIKTFYCYSEKDTQNLAERLSFLAQKGDVFALYGTLGAGKSTFSRYFIKKLADVEDVPSPTFTLVQMYDTPLFDIYHYDFYRLKYPEEAYELNTEEAFYSGVCLIEWPDKIGSILPKDVWKITVETNGNERIFKIEGTSLKKEQRLRDFFNE